MTSNKRILNCISSRETENDWRLKKAKTDGVISVKPKIPLSVDLRDNTWWKIKNQGTSGSCVGWAATDSLLRWHFTKKRKIKKEEDLSVRFIWMSAKEMDEFSKKPTACIDDSGTSIKTALSVARRFGVVKEEVLPFHGEATKLGEDKFFKLAAKLKIKSYYNLIPKKGNKLDDFKLWLAHHGPILTCLDCDKSWNKIKNNGFLEKYFPKTIDGGHAVSIVGYTPTHFIIRNSWGTDWGDKGYAYASYEYAQAAFNEAYGITI